jgi:hypothetical protein
MSAALNPGNENAKSLIFHAHKLFVDKLNPSPSQLPQRNLSPKLLILQVYL